MFTNFVLPLFFLFLSLYCTAQNQNWYINGEKILNFSVSPLTVDFFNASIINQGYNVSVSDLNGNLLFISNGADVLNNEGDIMLNGDNLDENFSFEPWGIDFAFQPIVTIPVMGQSEKYYLFTLSDGFFNFLSAEQEYLTSSLHYSVLDMSLDEGKGDITEGQKNIFLIDNLSGAMTPILGDCGSVWLLTHEYNSNKFIAFEVTEAGISNPVISEIGQTLQNVPNSTQINNLNGLFASPAGNKIVLFLQTGVQLFTFNQEVGIISNPIDLPINSEATSGTFSPNGDYFYVIESEAEDSSIISRITVNEPTADAVQDSKTAVGSISIASNLTTMQYAPNGRIYGTVKRNIYEIQNPDAEDVGAVSLTDTFIIDGGNETGQFTYNLPQKVLVPCIQSSNEQIRKESLNVEISPNPFHSDLQISINSMDSESIQFKLFDTMGRLIYQVLLSPGQLDNPFSLPSSLISGTYFYEVSSSKRAGRGKLTKLR